jgi:hypothetical protein
LILIHCVKNELLYGFSGKIMHSDIRITLPIQQVNSVLAPLAAEGYRLILFSRIDTDYKAYMFFGQHLPWLQVESPLHSLVSDYAAAHVDSILGVVIHVCEHEEHVARTVTRKELLHSLLEGRSL